MSSPMLESLLTHRLADLQLSRDTVLVLADYSRPLESVLAELCRCENIRGPSGEVSDAEPKTGDSFGYYGVAIELVRLIDAITDLAGERTTPTAELGRLAVAAEYVLFRLTGLVEHCDDADFASCPVRPFQLPFLPHWVAGASVGPIKERSRFCRLLLEGNIKDFDSLSAAAAGRLAGSTSFASPFLADPFEQLIAAIEGGMSPSEAIGAVKLPSGSSDGRSRLANVTVEDVKSWVGLSPSVAVDGVRHLPVTLASADLMVQLASAPSRLFLAENGIDVDLLIQDFIQHALRQIEGVPDSSRDDDAGPMTGERDLRTVAYTVSLLVLLIRSLVTRQLVPARTLVWEARELIYRFPWVPEVPVLRDMFARLPRDSSAQDSVVARPDFAVGG